MTKKELRERRLRLYPPVRKKYLTRINRGLMGIGELFSFISYRKNTKTKITLVPATWSHVVVLAIVNAFLVSVVRIAWFQTFGEPEVRIADPIVEAKWKEEYADKTLFGE